MDKGALPTVSASQAMASLDIDAMLRSIVADETSETNGGEAEEELWEEDEDGANEEPQKSLAEAERYIVANTRQPVD